MRVRRPQCSYVDCRQRRPPTWPMQSNVVHPPTPANSLRTMGRGWRGEGCMLPGSGAWRKSSQWMRNGALIRKPHLKEHRSLRPRRHIDAILASSLPRQTAKRLWTRAENALAYLHRRHSARQFAVRSEMILRRSAPRAGALPLLNSCLSLLLQSLNGGSDCINTFKYASAQHAVGKLQAEFVFESQH